MSAKLVLIFVDRAFRLDSAEDPYSRNLAILDRIRHYFFLVAPQSYSRG
jgi:hypothetical protein